MSALASAIHDTKHFHVRLGQACPSFLRPNCDGSGCWTHHHAGACRCQRASISTAPNPHGIRFYDALPGSCPIAICRRTAQDWRGARRRPLDGSSSRASRGQRSWIGRTVAKFGAWCNDWMSLAQRRAAMEQSAGWRCAEWRDRL